MATLSELLNKLATYGGKIVSTGELSEMEIVTANTENRMYVGENALGFVWVGKTSDEKEALHIDNVIVSVCECGDLSPTAHGRNGAVCGFCDKPKAN